MPDARNCPRSVRGSHGVRRRDAYGINTTQLINDVPGWIATHGTQATLQPQTIDGQTCFLVPLKGE